MPFWDRLRLAPRLETQKGIVVGVGWTVTAKKVEPSFETMINYYLTDPHVKGAIDELAESAVGHGFYLTSKSQDALGIAEDFCEDIDLDGLNQNISRELWATGNCMMEKVDPDNIVKIVHLPISSFQSVKLDDYGKVRYWEQKIGSKTQKFGEGGADLNRLIHWSWNRIDASIVGRGLLDPLVREGVGYTYTTEGGTTITESRPNFMSIIEETEDSMRKILHRYVPRHLYKLIGYSDDNAASHAETIKSLRPEDDIIMSVPNKEKMDVDVTRIAVDPRSRLDPFVEYFANAKIVALETPSIKLFLEAGFTEASARTAVQVLDRKVAAFRRFLKRRIEGDIVRPKVIQELGWNDRQYKEAELRLNWGIVEAPKPTVENMLNAYYSPNPAIAPAITRKELRENLKIVGFKLLEETQ